ncbi:hypothetical protein [Vulcanisaeta sp. JCM 14467]|uniref:hypothetical protein n=1 Tax=Vulcanisaeta sp. JCM 14467 TaxID=1295370 RepID=UPI000B247AEB|nr:hypothetical protein [Vulcanisaeta sp. JCM 14467]
MLLWNLSQDSFLEVVNEIKDKLPGGSVIDPKVLWQLLGGNVRALADLAINYGWNVTAWLNSIIRHVRYLIFREAQLLNISGASPLITRIKIFLGNNNPRPDDLIYEASIDRAPLIEYNVLIYVLGKPLMQLPNEEWVGNDYAYQLPAYYWVLRTMISKESINVTSSEVINEIINSAK